MNREPNAVVCLAASNTWYGKAIRWVTQSNVNHAFIAYYSDVHGGWQALQTDKRGLVEVPVEGLRYSYTECYELPVLDLLTALPRCRNLIGDAYDTLGIVGFLFKIIVWRLAGRRVLKPLHRKGELFCSEFVVGCLQRVDDMYSWAMSLDPSSVAPGGLAQDLGVPSLQEIFRTHPEVERVECPFKVGGKRS